MLFKQDVLDLVELDSAAIVFERIAHGPVVGRH